MKPKIYFITIARVHDDFPGGGLGGWVSGNALRVGLLTWELTTR